MLSKKQIQYLKRLHQKKNRQNEGLFLVEGRKNVSDLLKSKLRIHSIYLSEQNADWDGVPDHLNKDVWSCSANDFSRFSYLKSPDGFAAVAHIPKPSFSDQFRKVLLLEEINDPGNLGTLLRSADWFGVDAVLISDNTADPYSPKAVQAAKGSLFRVPVLSVNLHSEINRMTANGFSIYAMEMNGTDLDRVATPEKWGILLGNEANGLQSNTLELTTHRVRIDKVASDSSIDSLNVGIAGSIAMFALSKK